MNNKMKLIIFDLDNTLFSFNDLWLKSNKKIFKEYNLFKNIDYEEFSQVQTPV